MPYRLFALSNFASLLALLGFPVLFEPWFDLPQLGYAWSVLYVAFVVLCVYTAWHSLNASAEGTDIPLTVEPAPQASMAVRPGASTQTLWLALSAMGSVMLLAVTNHVTQNIASVPFLWVVPLSLYLLTFILCFDHPRWYLRPVFFGAALLLVPATGFRPPTRFWSRAMHSCCSTRAFSKRRSGSPSGPTCRRSPMSGTIYSAS